MTRKLLVFQCLVLAAALAVTAILYPHLPARVATHWGMHGQPNGYSSRASLFLFGPGLLFATMLLTALLPWLSPRHFEVDTFRSTYRRIMTYLYVMIAYLDAVMLWLASGHAIDAGRAIVGGVCLFLALIGNLLGKVRRNFYIGVRTPWTIANERVWNSTHRFAARTLVAAGALGLLFSMLGLVNWPIFAILAGALAPAIYSLAYYKQLERRGELGNGAKNDAETAP
jgi:uncharacterized membrane protein